MPAAPKTGTSENTKTIITVLLLLFVSPIGLIVMWLWPKWATWVKVLLTVPVILAGTISFITIGAMMANPQVGHPASAPTYQTQP